MDLYPNHRVSSNLLKCLHEWTKSHDKRNPTDGIYLDYEKAFDCVPIQCLLHKIEHLGIRGNLLATFSPELSMCVLALSELRNVFSGVPLGSVLGPLLFILHLTDLKSVLEVPFWP